jgi:hypothetical protein
MAKICHFSGYKWRGFKADNPVFKPNIGDFGAYFFGIRINVDIREKRISLFRVVCLWVPVTGQGPVDRST